MAGRKPRAPASPPKDTAEGAEAIRKFVLKLFHREDGDAADWELITGSLFKAGFAALDKLPKDRKEAFAARLRDLAYEVVEAAKEIEPTPLSKTVIVDPEARPSNSRVWKSKGPHPPG